MVSKGLPFQASGLWRKRSKDEGAVLDVKDQAGTRERCRGPAKGQLVISLAILNSDKKTTTKSRLL